MNLTPIEAEMILSLAENNLSLSEAARAMYMHRNAILYHVKKLRDEYGIDLLNLRDLLRVLPLAKRIYTQTATRNDPNYLAQALTIDMPGPIRCNECKWCDIVSYREAWVYDCRHPCGLEIASANGYCNYGEPNHGKTNIFTDSDPII